MMIKLHIKKTLLALQKKQLENEVALEERQMQFFHKFLDEQRKLESEEREKDRKFFYNKYHS